MRKTSTAWTRRTLLTAAALTIAAPSIGLAPAPALEAGQSLTWSASSLSSGASDIN